MSRWSSPRDEFPESVHSLMALWGGFAPPVAFNDSGLEKRLQFDFRALPGGRHSPQLGDDVAVVMRDAEQEVRDRRCEGEMEVMSLTDSLAVLTRNRLLITSSSAVRLHVVVCPMLALLSSRGIQVEWFSFLRKNLSSPWASACETGDIMAQEYAELKSAFPSGRSFLTGPVDGEHYFHYVFDDVHEEAGVPEVDTQFNVYLFDVETGVPEKDAKHPLQELTPLPRGGYEIQRIFADARCVSFETNGATPAFAPPNRLTALLKEFSPRRFTLVIFQDRDVSEGELRCAFRHVEGYTVANRTINYFSKGYAFHHVSFTRA